MYELQLEGAVEVLAQGAREGLLDLILPHPSKFQF